MSPVTLVDTSGLSALSSPPHPARKSPPPRRARSPCVLSSIGASRIPPLVESHLVTVRTNGLMLHRSQLDTATVASSDDWHNPSVSVRACHERRGSLFGSAWILVALAVVTTQRRARGTPCPSLAPVRTHRGRNRPGAAPRGRRSVGGGTPARRSGHHPLRRRRLANCPTRRVGRHLGQRAQRRSVRVGVRCSLARRARHPATVASRVARAGARRIDVGRHLRPVPRQLLHHVLRHQ